MSVPQLSFKGHTVVITGAGGGLGRSYSLLFASRGANVVVNDINSEAAQKVVDQIINAGGKAVKNTSSVTDGAALVNSALDAFGGVTILINNAGILRDKGFKKMTDKEWDEITEVHLKGAFACTKAAWPHFRKQKFGRILNTASAAGLYGNFGQANYAAAKMALVGFTKTLAIEGVKYGIKATVISPIAASPMSETIMSAEMLANLQPTLVAPFVLAVCHPDGVDATGKAFEVGGGFVAEIRWERSKGTVFKTDSSFTPSAVKAKWYEVGDFSGADHPKSLSDADTQGKLKLAATLPPNAPSFPQVRFDDKTVIVTGAGAGLGRAYAQMYGKLGANVVVNDISKNGAISVVDEIVKAGGKAVAAICSAEDGEAIVKTALETFNGVHVLIANAGILRDKSFQAMTEQEWDIVVAIHLRAPYKCAKAVWPIFQEQKFGRIVTICSQVAIYGNFGQANYAAAKAGVIGFTRTLAIEGKKYNIIANCIAPSAGTALTSTIWSQAMVDAFKPDFVAPVVGYLTCAGKDGPRLAIHCVSAYCLCEKTTSTPRAPCLRFPVAGPRRPGGSALGGYSFPAKVSYTPEDVVAKWSSITDFSDGRTTHPSTTAEALEQIVANFGSGGDAKAML
ncbi:Peroxisomal hydratase-dehydrogenase-epimerase [Mycena venus]|uniref:Peroxisomal hydratase-dehydrogenase-epimerase n=1 Tax=Mycena venus TaxID=2733690 RepID=A0A8H6Z3J7_9AGAR|nr:Peroxisomal hydratase-dehydrogenase-epimerase [Mycena venus]